MLQAPIAVAILPGIRHGFFTRAGGVSTGVYASLNGGTGSNDKPDHVAENRARMAAALGVAPAAFSPPIKFIRRMWSLRKRRGRTNSARARTPSSRSVPGTRDRRLDRGLRPGPVRRCAGARHRRGARRLARRVDRRDRSDRRRNGKARRAARAHRRRDRSDDPPAQLRGRRRSGRPFVAVEPDNSASSRRPRATGHAMFDLAGYVGAPAAARGCRPIDDLALCTYAEPARFYQLPPHDASRRKPDYGRHINAIVLARLTRRPVIGVGWTSSAIPGYQFLGRAAQRSRQQGWPRGGDADGRVARRSVLRRSVRLLRGCAADRVRVAPAAGCAALPGVRLASVAASPRGTTVAFESIDGLPRDSFRSW